VYKRWVAFGLMSSHSRLHGSRAYKVPWLFDEESVDVLRFFTKLKCALMPYIFAAAVEASKLGTPMMRAMMLEFPGDEACSYLDRQYMLGPDLLVAPVFSAEGDVSFYLPPGRWTRLLPALGEGKAEAVEGGRWMREKHDFMSMPLFARPGSIIPIGAVDNKADYDYAEGAAFHVFETMEGVESSASVADLGGAEALSCRVILKGDRLSIKVAGRAGTYKVALRAAKDGSFLVEAGNELIIDLGRP
jgi:alpha-D-xyloside xylohydrolase